MAPHPLQGDQHKPSPKVRYKMENWQIPVPIGDASAHFLLEELPPVGGILAKPAVINAFFMDGGDDAKGAKAFRHIALALEGMDRHYGFRWKFDAIVITHQDADHFKGLMALTKESGSRDKISGTYLALYFRDTLTYYSGAKKNIKWHPGKGVGRGDVLGEDCIGVDLFSKTRIFSRHGSVSHVDFDKENGIRSNLINSNRPRFVVVGANGFGVSRVNSLSFIEDPTPNQTSILAVAYWPGKKGRTSYFTGGDGNPVVELRGVVPWMEGNKPGSGLPVLPVDMVKLDHHGSLNEAGISDKKAEKLHETLKSKSGAPAPLSKEDVAISQRNILHQMEPTGIIVTPGNRHGHPNWVVMLLVRQYFAMMRQGRPDGFRAHQQLDCNLYVTRTPYWHSNPKGANPKNAGEGIGGIIAQQYIAGIQSKTFDQDNIRPLDWAESQPEDTESDDSDYNKNVGFAKGMKTFDETYKEKNATFWTFVKKQNMFLADETYDVDKFNKEEKERDKAEKQQFKKIKDEYAKDNEEPRMDDWAIAKAVAAEMADQISIFSQVDWHTISPQPISQAKSVYWLVRFSFWEDKLPQVNYEVDEKGEVNAKPKDTFIPKPAKPAKKQKQSGFGRHAPNLEDSFQRSEFMLEQMTGELSFHGQMTGVNLAGLVVQDPVGLQQTLGQASDQAAPKLPVVDPLKALLPKAFEGQKVKNFLTGTRQPFMGEKEALETFAGFMKIYQPDLYYDPVKDKAYPLRKRRSRKGDPHVSMPIAQKELKTMFNRFQELQDLLENAIRPGYNEHIKMEEHDDTYYIQKKLHVDDT